MRIGIGLSLTQCQPPPPVTDPAPPAGFAFITRANGTILTNAAGAYFVKAIA